jgi:hypothetical protein
VSLLIACGGNDDSDDAQEQAQVELTVQAAINAYNQGDVPGFLAYWTDSGLQTEFDATREQIQAAPDQYLGGPPRQIRSITNTRIREDQAVTDTEFILGWSIERERIGLLREGEAWKIAGTEPLSVDLPESAKTIDVEMNEFSYKFDASQITDGNIAFRTRNTGRQPHELILLRVPDDFNLQAALQDGQLPPGVEVIGGVPPKAPGQEANLVFAWALPAGRHMMLCFLPDTSDPQGTPHVLKGMVAEFDIPAQGGGP